MRTFLIGATALVLTAGSAAAADLAVRPSAAPAPYVLPFSWTGLYIGVHAGYGWGDGNGTFAGVNLGSEDVDGPFGGLQIGYNWQAGSFVFGLETDVSLADIGVSQTALGVTASSQIDWFGTLRGRVGAAFGQALLYVTGGFAWAHNDVDVTALGVTISEGHGHTGWTIGGGLEYAFAGPWSAKLEYLYLDFGRKTYFATLLPPGVGLDANVHTVRLGVNYRFGAGP